MSIDNTINHWSSFANQGGVGMETMTTETQSLVEYIKEHSEEQELMQEIAHKITIKLSEPKVVESLKENLFYTNRPLKSVLNGLCNQWLSLWRDDMCVLSMPLQTQHNMMSVIVSVDHFMIQPCRRPVATYSKIYLYLIEHSCCTQSH